MGRRGVGALLWHKVDTMVTNRELRLEAEEGSWDVVDEWLKHYQNGQRKKTASPATGAALPEKKTNNKKKLLKSRSKQQITHKSVPGSSRPVEHPPYLQNRFDSKSSFNRDKVQQRCESPGAVWQRPPLPKPNSSNNNNNHSNDTGDLFMDREYMQQMQRRLLEQHEETLKRRIRQRQAEEAQRERQLMLAGLVPTPTNHTTVVHTPKRGMHSQPNSRASQHSSRSLSAYTRAAPRPRTGRPRPVSSPRPRDRPSSQHKKTVRNVVEEPLPPESPPPEDDDLDEAAEPSPPPPPKPETRPRLAILLQACRAVVGANQPTETPLTPAAPIQLPEEEVGPGALRGIKYESPLLAKLREVENVEELYRLAELIVAHTKHP